MNLPETNLRDAEQLIDEASEAPIVDANQVEDLTEALSRVRGVRRDIEQVREFRDDAEEVDDEEP